MICHYVDVIDKSLPGFCLTRGRAGDATLARSSRSISHVLGERIETKGFRRYFHVVKMKNSLLKSVYRVLYYGQKRKSTKGD